jgi:hypothetical protein
MPHNQKIWYLYTFIFFYGNQSLCALVRKSWKISAAVANSNSHGQFYYVKISLRMPNQKLCKPILNWTNSIDHFGVDQVTKNACKINGKYNGHFEIFPTAV